MPGLVGFVGKSGAGKSETLLADMVRAIKYEDWYQVDLYQGEDFGLGRVSLGFLNPEPQPIWNEDETLCLVMEGEVYDYQDLKKQLVARGHRFRIDNDAEFVLHLYEEFGEEFASQLNGAFVAAIWNRPERKLTIANDRFGLRPLFYTQLGERLLFASGTQAILADPGFRPRVNVMALAEFLTLEYVLGDKTLFEDIFLLPPASYLTHQDGQLTITPYWELQPPAIYADHPESHYLEGALYYVRQAVQRRMRGDGPIGIQLSGGRDSRVVLALIDKSHYPVQTFTFGIPDCDDARIAREVASKSGTHHSFDELRPDFLLTAVEEGVRLSDGLNSCIHMHGIANLRAMAQHVRILYTGSLGDSLMSGNVVQRDLLAVYDEETMARKLFQEYARCFDEAGHARLFSDEFYRQVQGHVFDSFRCSFAGVKAPLAASKRLYYSIRQANRRWILEGQRLLRSQIEVRLPFYDNDLVDFMLSVPLGWLIDGYLYNWVLSQASPTLAKIPYEATGLPLVPCMRDLSIRAGRQARWRLRQMGLKQISLPQKRPYADYDLWMRTVLREWVEDILLDRRSLQRGYLRPEYVRTLVEQHMRAEGNFAHELGVLLTFELWHRLFLDQHRAG
jgi:asparagine synthase (glutamine-hydrolysing)